MENLPPEKRPRKSTGRKAAKLLIRLLMAVIALAWVVVVAKLAFNFSPLGRSGWIEAALLLLALAGTLAVLSRRLPLQNVLLASVGIAAIGGGMHAFNAKMSIPFGPMIYGNAAGPRIFDTVPWTVPVLWVVIILNSRGAARLALRPWRKTGSYGILLAGVTVALAVLFDAALEPFASGRQQYWLWEATRFPVTWQGVPVMNFISFAAISLLILAVLTPSLINKKPVRKRRLEIHPFGIWLGGIALFTAAAAANHAWQAAIVDGIIGIATTALVIRGLRW